MKTFFLLFLLTLPQLHARLVEYDLTIAEQKWTPGDIKPVRALTIKRNPRPDDTVSSWRHRTYPRSQPFKKRGHLDPLARSVVAKRTRRCSLRDHSTYPTRNDAYL